MWVESLVWAQMDHFFGSAGFLWHLQLAVEWMCGSADHGWPLMSEVAAGMAELTWVWPMGSLIVQQTKSSLFLWWIGRVLGENASRKSLESKLPRWHFCYILCTKLNHS